MGASPISRRTILVNYSHQDEVWAHRIRAHLEPVTKDLIFVRNRQIQVGDEWHDQEENPLETATAVVLLISPDFISSAFAQEQGLSSLLKKRTEKGLTTIPVLVRPCSWHQVPALRALQLWPREGQVLAALSTSEIDASLLRLTGQLAAVLELPLFGESRKTLGLRGRKLFFISHAYEDGDFAELIQQRLEKEGYDAWVGTERLVVGIDWREEIDQTIRQATAIIVIVTPESKRSEYVTYEWAFGWGLGVEIIPIMLKPTPLHPRIETLQFLDFTNRAARPWDALMRALRSAEKSRNPE